MSERPQKGMATVAQLTEFDAVLDARSPSEFAEDHLPNALNCPALSNEERVRVGTLYKQKSVFEAKKVGAVLVARNIATHIETLGLNKPKSWRPLVYCWRGGKRSGAFTHVLREIGWDAHQLEGGYKAWRRHVVHELTTLPSHLSYRVISGATGSAKSRILEALAQTGAQILHLEALAAHKGSVLGNLPGVLQPSQKAFESRLFAAFSRLDPARPVFVEAESRRIGTLQVPESLIVAIRAAPCLRIEATAAARVDFLLRDYDYFLTDPQRLLEKLTHLSTIQSRETLDLWREMIEKGDFRTLVTELLTQHYDPLYQRSQSKNYLDFTEAAVFQTNDLSAQGIQILSHAILNAPL